MDSLENPTEMADDGQGVAEAAVAPATRTNEGEILLSFSPTKESFCQLARVCASDVHSTERAWAR